MGDYTWSQFPPDGRIWAAVKGVNCEDSAQVVLAFDAAPLPHLGVQDPTRITLTGYGSRETLALAAWLRGIVHLAELHTSASVDPIALTYQDQWRAELGPGAPLRSERTVTLHVTGEIWDEEAKDFAPRTLSYPLPVRHVRRLVAFWAHTAYSAAESHWLARNDV